MDVLLPFRRRGRGGRDEIRDRDVRLLLVETFDITDFLPLLVLRFVDSEIASLLSPAEAIMLGSSACLRSLLRCGCPSFKNFLNDIPFRSVGLLRCINDDEDDDLA